jgi:two-component system, response regulator PdtaR
LDDKKKILIVEDEVLVSMYLEMQFRKSDYEILGSVTNGEEAVKIALEDKPDVILMDIRLAGTIDGIQAAEKIRSEYTPMIVFMTGYQSTDFKVRMAQLTNFAILEKPLKMNELFRIIATG